MLSSQISVWHTHKRERRERHHFSKPAFIRNINWRPRPHAYFCDNRNIQKQYTGSCSSNCKAYTYAVKGLRTSVCYHRKVYKNFQNKQTKLVKDTDTYIIDNIIHSCYIREQ